MPAGALALLIPLLDKPVSSTTMPRLAKVDGLLQQRVRADDDADPDHSFRRELASSACRHRGPRVSSATRVAFSAPPSWPPMASGPRTSWIDRRVLCGQSSVGAGRPHW